MERNDQLFVTRVMQEFYVNPTAMTYLELWKGRPNIGQKFKCRIIHYYSRLLTVNLLKTCELQLCMK